MTISNFLLIPTEIPVHEIDWANLSREDKMFQLETSRANLTSQIKNRFDNLNLEYLNGVDVWIMHFDVLTDYQEVINKLVDLPLQVVTNDQDFSTAISNHANTVL